MGLKKGLTPNRSPRTIPVLNNQQQLVQGLQKWKTTINQSLKQPQTPGGVLNFKVTPMAAGNQLTWSHLPGSDGYVLYKSDTPDFSKNVTSIPLNNAQYVSHFDGTDKQQYYKIAATNGTITKPNSVIGAPTPISGGSPSGVATPASVAAQISSSSITIEQIVTPANASSGEVPVANGDGTASWRFLATDDLSDWTNAGIANGDVPVWNSGTMKWTATAGGGAPSGSGNKIYATPADGSSGLAALRVAVVNDYKFHDEVLTDGASNIIFAGGDVVMTVGVPN